MQAVLFGNSSCSSAHVVICSSATTIVDWCWSITTTSSRCFRWGGPIWSSSVGGKCRKLSHTSNRIDTQARRQIHRISPVNRRQGWKTSFSDPKIGRSAKRRRDTGRGSQYVDREYVSIHGQNDRPFCALVCQSNEFILKVEQVPIRLDLPQ